MVKNYEAVLAALTVPCRKCGSGSGSPCLTWTHWNGHRMVATLDSRPTKPHAERVKAAKRLKGI